MTPLETKVRAALKDKWLNDDHDIDMAMMVKWSGASEEELRKIITQYESELLATKFNIK